MSLYPKDRMPFLKDWGIANLDKIAFSDYGNGLITLSNLCRRLAENTNLPYVTEEQALNEFQICGWLR